MNARVKFRSGTRNNPNFQRPDYRRQPAIPASRKIPITHMGYLTSSIAVIDAPGRVPKNRGIQTAW